MTILHVPSPESIRYRAALVYLCFATFFVIVVGRLVQLQVLINPELDSLARKQYEKEGKTSDYRLPILDRNGEELAVSIPATSVFARPRLVTHRRRTARTLARILGGSEKAWLSRLKVNRPFVWIRRQIEPDLFRRLADLELEGIYFESENKRVYPNGKLAAHVLGFTDIDGNGLAGIELAFNEQLSRPPSAFFARKDGKGNPSYIQGTERGPTESGIRLTLDRQIQYVLEEELEAAAKEFEAEAVLGVIMEPFTGEILAMGQRPTFDPNEANRFSSTTFANRLVSHRFEPGSTLKVIFGAAAIQEGILKPGSPIDCKGGKIRIAQKTIAEAEDSHKFGVISFDKVIRYSSNVGAVRIAQILGPQRVGKTIDTFGLTSKTEITLPGEVTSARKEDQFWTPISLATVGFGQGISVTPLQLVAAYAPFSNGGFWVRPEILMGDARRAPTGSERDIRRVLSLNTAATMRDILVSVTESRGGTGFLARVPNVHVAGKTGTAQKYVTGKGYDGGSYFSSFIGFLPAENPRLLIGIMVDEPKKSYYAAQVAAPLFARVAERSLRLLGHAPKKTLTGSNVVRKEPLLPSGPVPGLSEHGQGQWLMPDLSGVSLRDSLTLLARHFRNLNFEGQGYVIEQSPQAGTVIVPKSPIHLRLSASLPGPQG